MMSKSYTLPQTSTTPTIKKTASRAQTITGLVMAALISIGCTAKAAVFTAENNGMFNEATVWTPSYPGNIINNADTVIIGKHVKLNVDVIVKGTLIVRGQSSLLGEKNLVVLGEGRLINQGITIVQSLTNRGTVQNRSILETSKDLINTGTLMNNQSMVVGNILDNVGTISGNGGTLIANNKLVNSQSGIIEGNIDVCSSNFMNVDGGTLDSTNISFCGNRIFNSVFLTASLKKESVQLNLLNSADKKFKEYRVERSKDGINFEEIASVKGKDITNDSTAFRYTDNEVLNTNNLYYRIKLIEDDGDEKMIPAVQIGNIYATGMKASTK
ncbi:MAG: hypothetical protein SFW35_05855 [Chitinophagales bacterium]|nr:hypothetical protein [Chitinophagales bacterium]